MSYQGSPPSNTNLKWMHQVCSCYCTTYLQQPFRTYLQGRMFGLKQKSLWHNYFSGFVRCSVQSWPFRNFLAWWICAIRSPGVLRRASHSGRYYVEPWITIPEHQRHRFNAFCQGHQWQKQKWLSHFCAVRSPRKLPHTGCWSLFPQLFKLKGVLTDKWG